MVRQDERYLSLKDALKKVNISETYLKELIDTGKLPGKVIDGEYYITDFRHLDLLKSLPEHRKKLYLHRFGMTDITEQEMLAIDIWDRFGFMTTDNLIYNRIYEAINSRRPVLIIGQEGSGREIISKSIHHYGYYNKGPYNSLRCQYTIDNSNDIKTIFNINNSVIFIDHIEKMQMPILNSVQNIIKEQNEDGPRIIASLDSIDPNHYKIENIFKCYNAIFCYTKPLSEQKKMIPSLLKCHLKNTSIKEVDFHLIAFCLLNEWQGNFIEFRNFCNVVGEICKNKLALLINVIESFYNCDMVISEELRYYFRKNRPYNLSENPNHPYACLQSIYQRPRQLIEYLNFLKFLQENANLDTIKIRKLVSKDKYGIKLEGFEYSFPNIKLKYILDYFPIYNERRNSILGPTFYGCDLSDANKSISKILGQIFNYVAKYYKMIGDSTKETLITREPDAENALKKNPKNIVYENPFKKMKDLKWSEISIEFLSNEEVKITARGKNKRYLFNELGFKNEKQNKPTKPWIVMLALAKYGQIDWNLPSRELDERGRNKIQSDISAIRKRLKEFFSIPNEDPFFPYQGKREKFKSYKPKFMISSQ